MIPERSSGSGWGCVRRGVRPPRPRREQRIAFAALGVLLALLLAASATPAYVVVRGDTLTKIARRHGTTVEAIALANSIGNPNLIIVGQRLVIPAPKPGVPAATPSQRFESAHTVVAGETLSGIAKSDGTTAGRLAEVNGIRNPNLIRPGQVLKVPGPPEPQTIEQLLERAASAHGLDPALVKGLAWQESGWNQSAVSSAGAVGVMQVLPETAGFISRVLLGRSIDSTKAEDNIEAGVRFLAHLLTLTGGDERLAVAGYFQGLRSVRTTGISPRTERFVANVLALKERFSR